MRHKLVGAWKTFTKREQRLCKVTTHQTSGARYANVLNVVVVTILLLLYLDASSLTTQNDRGSSKLAGASQTTSASQYSGVASQSYSSSNPYNNNNNNYNGQQQSSPKLLRLCIASVDPAKLSSQCVMCTRRAFPANVIHCTGLNRVNQLISTPLSLIQATCLIYNCRKDVPYIKPEPYHGTATIASYPPLALGASSSALNNQRLPAPLSAAAGVVPPVATSLPDPRLIYPGMNPLSYQHQLLTAGLMPSPTASLLSLPSYMHQQMSSVPRASQLASLSPALAYATAPHPQAFLPAGSSVGTNGGVGPNSLQTASRSQPLQAMPYAIVPTSYTSLLGMRRYKTALVPLF